MKQRTNTNIQSINKGENEDILSYATRLSDWYLDIKDLPQRKVRGQFFTPKEISSFMANLFTISKNRIDVLDAGAGVGVLSAAFCFRLLKLPRKIEIKVDAYENDSRLIPLLKAVLDACQDALAEKGHKFVFNIRDQDFILENEGYFKENKELGECVEYDYYDYIISNPPYYKLNKKSPNSRIMSDFILGRPNIYSLFMALSAKMLKADGEMVFITPRSFCSGHYYKRFRKWFLNMVSLEQIHIFESRRGLFKKDSILQENIIVKATKSKKDYNKIRISSSKSKCLDALKEIDVDCSDVLFHKNGDIFIRIPISQKDVNIIHIIDSWPCTLKDIGLEISTGPVVSFRTKENLQTELTGDNYVPLIWMHNFKEMKIKWPLEKNKKPLGIVINKTTESILLPVKNYVLIKRFSSKEQKRRLCASVLLKEELSYAFLGIENHVNYIHKVNGELSRCESFGLAALLNTTFVDNYFRSLNGNTQVNATDIRSLPFPAMQDITRIGKKVESGKNSDFDHVVAQVLNIDLNFG